MVFTGDGKGKTTAALGVVLRSLAHGRKVCFITFMKGAFPYGEKKALTQFPNFVLKDFGHLHFVDPQNVKEEEKEEARQALKTAREAITSGEYDLVVLDEVNIASAWGLIDKEEIVKLIKDKPLQLDLILTGRYAPQGFIELADLVTEMKEVKHPFKKGILAKKGIDY